MTDIVASTNESLTVVGAIASPQLTALLSAGRYQISAHLEWLDSDPILGGGIQFGLLCSAGFIAGGWTVPTDGTLHPFTALSVVSYTGTSGNRLTIISGDILLGSAATITLLRGLAIASAGATTLFANSFLRLIPIAESAVVAGAGAGAGGGFPGGIPAGMPSLDFPLDKLGIINHALAATANNMVNVADDGSDEWTAGSKAYDLAMPYLMETHGWTWSTIVATLAASPTAPTDDLYSTAYDKPSDLLHLIWVRLDDRPCVYDILANQIILNALGVSPGVVPPAGTTPGVVTIKYVSANGSDVQRATPTFNTALVYFVMAHIYRGYHEDPAEADKITQMAEALLQRARTRSDQEKPKRAMFNSRITASRRIRRPWPPVPTGWGSTGVPG